MAKRENQKAKLLHLYKLLLERTDAERGLTLEEMASALESVGIAAERKSLYDDLRVLRECGLDIEMHRGRAVTYHVVSRDFELPELKLLVDAVQSSKFITHKKSAELIKKLSALTSQREAQQLQRQVFVANRIKTMNESIYYTVDAVQDALAQGVQISFRYFSWNEKKEKDFHHNGEHLTVSPWALVWDDENYYLIAYESESGRIKHYRVDKMLSVRALSEKRDGAEHFRDFDAAVYSKKTFGMFGGREETVRLRCTNDLAGVMLDRFGQDVIFVPDGEAHFTLSVRVSISPVFLAWVMSFGKKVSVLSPESVRGEVAAAAREVLAQYEGEER